MRVLFAVHHPLDARLGAPSASMAVARELERDGHTIEFFGYDHAFPGAKTFSARHQVAFPWKLANFLTRSAGRFDVLDITTGDSYVWGTIARHRTPTVALVTRSNGLEHLAHEARLAEATRGRIHLSWRYPIYNGGLRLWEVKRSIRIADAVVALTEDEKMFAVARLGANPDTTWVIPHGLDAAFLSSLKVGEEPMSGSTRLCFLGNWTDGKGTDEAVSVVEMLAAQNVDFELLIAGAGQSHENVLACFSPEASSHVRVVERYQREELPALLADRQILLFPSRFEGFGLALLEAMACGVVPVTTDVGVARTIVRNGENGVIVERGRPEEIAAAVRRLGSNRAAVVQMGERASATARSYTWRNTAERTLALYDLARQGRRRGYRPRTT